MSSSQTTPQPNISQICDLIRTVSDPDWLAQASLVVSSQSNDLVAVQSSLDQAWLATTGWSVPSHSSPSNDGDQPSVSDRAVVEARRDTRQEIARRRRLLDCWRALSDLASASTGYDASNQDDVLDLEDDPWEVEVDDDDEDDSPGHSGPAADLFLSTSRSTSFPTQTSTSPWLPFDLQTFLTTPVAQLALLLTTPPQCPRLLTFVSYAKSDLFPYRFAILEAIPDWIAPAEFIQLLPSCDEETQLEEAWASDLRVPAGADDEVASIHLVRPSDPSLSADATSSSLFLAGMSNSPPRYDLLSAAELSSWYRKRIESIESVSGLVDVSLAYVQHGASRGIPDLDRLGEDLSLLSLLIYDARLLPMRPPHRHEIDTSTPSDEDWTLARFQASSPQALTTAYLRYATPTSIVPLIKTVLFPYLFVLLSRSERAGEPDHSLPARHVQAWLLEAPLSLAAEVFAASKATLSEPERILKRDEEVARLALAILYGSRETKQWEVMSRIFECLPAWEFGPDDHEGGEGATTLFALGQFLRPTPSSPPPPPTELHTFFLPLSSLSLSFLLDTLDVHLESAEVLSRWSVPATLGWFILSANDRQEQLAWATRVSKRGGPVADRDGSEGWDRLLRDMKKLRGDGSDVMGAFGMLSEEEVVRIYFSGLLGSGNFALAKKLLDSRPPPLDRSIVEELVLAASVEYYENADSGNMHQGDMQLAYACLSVASPSSPAIAKELAFIEATSKIASYRLPSSSGGTLTPLEIRLCKDRLSLVSRILSQSEDAYKHPEVILDLVNKLGFEGDKAAEVKTLGMLADASVQAGDWHRGVGFVEKMIEVVGSIGKKPKLSRHTKTDSTASTSSIASDRSLAGTPWTQMTTPVQAEEAIEVCWRTCFQFGRQAEFGDLERKLTLIGQALVLCPPDMISDVLPSWRKLEEDRARQPRRISSLDLSHPSSIPLPASPALPSTSSIQQPTRVPQERKRDIAARTFGQFSSSLSSFRPLSAAASSVASRSSSPAGGFLRPSSPFLGDGGGGGGGIGVGSSEASQTANSRNDQGLRAGSSDTSRDVSSLFSQEGSVPDPLLMGRSALNRGVGWLLGASKDEMGGEVI